MFGKQNYDYFTGPVVVLLFVSTYPCFPLYIYIYIYMIISSFRRLKEIEEGEVRLPEDGLSFAANILYYTPA
jgi:hypothetical protein